MSIPYLTPRKQVAVASDFDGFAIGCGIDQLDFRHDVTATERA
jgi:hypothetical protein